MLLAHAHAEQLDPATECRSLLQQMDYGKRGNQAEAKWQQHDCDRIMLRERGTETLLVNDEPAAPARGGDDVGAPCRRLLAQMDSARGTIRSSELEAAFQRMGCSVLMAADQGEARVLVGHSNA